MRINAAYRAYFTRIECLVQNVNTFGKIKEKFYIRMLL